MMVTALRRLATPIGLALAVLASSGCFASIAQLDEVRDDVSVSRAEAAVADSVRATQLVQILRSLREVNDSLAALSQRMVRLRAETQADVRGITRQVGQALEVTGQSEARLKELRSQIDTRIRNSTPPPAAVLPPANAADTVPVASASTPPVTVEPGAEELYRIGRDQLTRGANGSARTALEELLRRHPDSELAADAQFLIAESHAAEGTTAAADAAYAAVVSRYADSPRAPTAMYKRGVLAQTARRTTAAKRLFNDLIQKYPESDESELARERLRVMG
ncbi:MAG: tetratricopeptide repeat protein [Gemmatimonadaceae bacterium]